MARYEDFSCNLLRLGQGRGIPAAGTQAATERNVGSLVTVTLTPAAVAASSNVDQTLTGIPGVELTDIVVAVRYPTNVNTWITKCTPNGANSLAVTFASNATGGTPTSGAYTFLVIKTQ
jgi:hypothetical protein